ncbi:MAG: hypothetical protein KTR25_17175 [Myxococcales bacterium]|nr:hypothetical protein [Myxococcales bacterium]
MKQVLSSIFSSELFRRRYEFSLHLMGACIIVLVFDLSIGLFFSSAESHRNPQTSIERYLFFGRSIEAKLTRKVGHPGQDPDPTIKAGWIANEARRSVPKNWHQTKKRVAIYGMSFTNQIADSIKTIDHTISVSARGGPSAPFNHSYALIENDGQHRDATHIVVGVLSKSIPFIQSNSTIGASFESPIPYTFPSYRWEKDRLITIYPQIDEQDEFVEIFRARDARWWQHLAQLRAHDPAWNDLLYYENVFDNSAFFRLLRRAWSKRVYSKVTASVYSPRLGYMTDNPFVAAVPHLLRKIEQRCKSKGQTFIVVLLHSRGEPGHLAAWLRRDLSGRDITLVSSTDHFSSTDAANFMADGHYTPEKTQALAEHVVSIVNQVGSNKISRL